MGRVPFYHCFDALIGHLAQSEQRIIGKSQCSRGTLYFTSPCGLSKDKLLIVNKVTVDHLMSISLNNYLDFENINCPSKELPKILLNSAHFSLATFPPESTLAQ